MQVFSTLALTQKLCYTKVNLSEQAVYRGKERGITLFAREFRAWARESLRGHWGAAVGVAFVGGLLGGGVDVVSYAVNGAQNEAYHFFESVPREVWSMMLTITLVSFLLAIVIGGAVLLGICTFNLNLINHREARFMDLFSQFHRLWQGFCMQFIMGLFIFLWSLLFIIPGIIAAYRYAMVPYLMAEFPDLGVMDAMRESKRLMHGNKWRLFCLQLSYIGWSILCLFTAGIGNLWLTPYMYAGETAFYMSVTGREQVRGQEQPGYRHEF